MTISKITCAAFLLSLGLLAGCGEKFLAEAPVDQITDANFYQTQQDAIQATNAAYSELTKEGQYNLAMWAFDIMADNSVSGGDDGNDAIEYKQLEAFSIPSTNTVVNRLWGGSFIGVQRANLVLQKVPGISMDETIKKRCLGEAQFLRAKFYFDLVRAYGDVPLFTAPPSTPAEVNIPRTPVAQVYGQIERDLLAAIGNLPDSYSGADLGRATKWAATGLLAKVYITEGKKAEAAVQARAVISGSGKTMWANYADNFKVTNENNNAKESLFEVQYVNGRNEYERNSVGSAMNEFFGPRGANQTPGSGYGFNVPEPDFVAGYEAGDTRKAATIFVPGDVFPDGKVQTARATGSPFGYNVRKWFVGKVNTNIWDSPLNVPVLRLAEMHLILAEAVGPTAEGLEAINKVRRRAFGLPLDVASAKDLTAATPDFTGAVLKERKYELAFEFDRWFDLKRYNGTQYGLIPVMTAQANYLKTLGITRGIPTEKNLVLPLPQSELDANPGLKQNPGY
ncbi:RagB/SusD family nutrient uptake outer membrane protein [Hymenobacter sp. DH14]|uniref:RagB/SusD family nutrient uptake outer membrane protein n=1 Tax=Hymenobacter cyanobacteriorum TaxID=2926463 RepID=A0A9X1VJQ2_9BACT|nr:RagB/SusD family nutrient uptake outer membrane protein [Hymenobacter cyanobacteriorum]MCI1190096.1 RagB/SusD family nutrient uptake outer membrane protein [Hymenobacter cyanobacteriorum]